MFVLPKQQVFQHIAFLLYCSGIVEHAVHAVHR